MSGLIDLGLYDSSAFDEGAPRWKRRLWLVVRCIFFQTSWPWRPRFRAGLLRVFGARVGTGLLFGANVNISYPWRLTIGDNVWIGDDVGVLSLAQVTIESNVCVSRRAFLCTGSHDFGRKDFKLKVAPITVRRGTWIAIGSLIAAGVTIGEGAVVSAGSVVLEDIPANCLVRGNPAQLVRRIHRVSSGSAASGFDDAPTRLGEAFDNFASG